MTAAHGSKSEVSRCIDACWCTVCGLFFDNEAVVSEHVHGHAICRLNMLLRGPHVHGDAHKEALSRRAAIRRKNKHSGIPQGKITNLCVRSFGPHKIIIGTDGERVFPSKR